MSRGRWLSAGSPQWGAIDQALSSGTNFALLLLTVRSVDTRAFGAFSLVYLLYVLSLPLARATGSMPFTIRYLNGDPGEVAAATSATLRYACGLGAALGGGCLAGAIFVGSPLRGPLLVLGISFPLLVAQDAIRAVMFAKSTFVAAILNDALWAAVQGLLLLTAFLTYEKVPVSVFMGSWAAGGVIAGIYGFWQLRVPLKLVNPLLWLREHWDLARPLYVTAVLTVLPAHLTYLLMPAVSSLSELGEVRAAYVLFGPMNVAFTTASMLALPHAVRLRRDDVGRFAAKVSLALAALSIAWAVAVTSLPDGIGRVLLGDVWSETAVVRVFLGISLVAEGIMVGPTTALAALGIPHRVSRVRYITAPFTLGAGLVLAGLYGAAGAALAFAMGYTLTALLAWLQVPRTKVGT